MIIFDYRLPSPPLRDYVRLYQIVGFEFKASENLPWKPYWPRPENCLSFYPRDTIQVEHINGHQLHAETRSAIVGQPCSLKKKYMVKKGLTLDFVLFQVVFQPGVLFRLTGIPMNELTDTVLDAEAIFSKEIHQVNQRLNSIDNHLEIVHIVEGFLSHLVGRVKYDRKPVDKVALYLLRQPRPVSLDWIASEACLSRKQFYRKFVERMGGESQNVYPHHSVRQRSKTQKCPAHQRLAGHCPGVRLL